MKYIKYLAAAAMIAMSAAPAIAAEDTLDSEGYPIMYVRGTFSGWSPTEAARLTRDGNTYSITMQHLDGEFKIAGDTWQYNYGSPTGQVYTISANEIVQGLPDGHNFNAPNLENLTISFNVNPENFGAPVNITFSNGGVVTVPGLSGTLPVLYINVYTDENHTAFNNEILSKDLPHKDYFSYSEYWLDLNGCEWLAEAGAQNVGSREEPLPLEIKARGNWTRIGFAKKPFKLKLGSKQKLLGMTKSKHYAILAHADDRFGYLRNFTGFNLGKRIGLPWTPAQQPVEVVINGDYRGLYFLTESIRIDKDRVNIAELDDNATDPELISGGYLVELDNYDEENQIRMEEKGCVSGNRDMLRITFDTPEEYSDIQRRFVTDQFTAMNDAVGSNNDDLWSYMDLDDAARYYIVEEIISHTESYHGSTYLFRDRGEGQKWHFSPLWDCGNAYSGPTDDFFYHHGPYGNTWIPSIRTNTKFNTKVADTWMWFMTNKYDGLENDINEYIDHIAAAAVADRNRWKDAPMPHNGVSVVDNSDLTSKRDEVLRRLREKTAWLRQHFGDYTVAGIVPEPERDDTPAAPLPSYAQTGVEDVAVDNPATAPEYYTIDGRTVANPQPGQLYIVRRGTAVTKEIVR